MKKWVPTVLQPLEILYLSASDVNPRRASDQAGVHEK